MTRGASGRQYGWRGLLRSIAFTPRLGVAYVFEPRDLVIARI
jgi:hypothetical protein